MTIKETLRDVLRRGVVHISRGRVITKRFGALGRSGYVCVAPEVMPSLWLPGFRNRQIRELFRWADELVDPGDTVWDIGANQGLFSFRAAISSGRGGYVMAVEPDPFLGGVIECSLGRRRHRAGEASIEFVPSAVADCSGTQELCIAASSRCLNFLAGVDGNPRTGGVLETLSIECVTMDCLAATHPKPDLIKMDIEGAEALALHGAHDVVRSCRPRFIVEVAENNSQDVTKFFVDYQYKLFDANSPHYSPVEQCAWNTYAVPA